MGRRSLQAREVATIQTVPSMSRLSTGGAVLAQGGVSGDGPAPQPGLETRIKPNSNQMRLALFQRPLSIRVLAREAFPESRCRRPGLCVPRSLWAPTDKLTSLFRGSIQKVQL